MDFGGSRLRVCRGAREKARHVIAHSIREGDPHLALVVRTHAAQRVWMPSSARTSVPSRVRSAAPPRKPTAARPSLSEEQRRRRLRVCGYLVAGSVATLSFVVR